MGKENSTGGLQYCLQGSEKVSISIDTGERHRASACLPAVGESEETGIAGRWRSQTTCQVPQKTEDGGIFGRASRSRKARNPADGWVAEGCHTESCQVFDCHRFKTQTANRCVVNITSGTANAINDACTVVVPPASVAVDCSKSYSSTDTDIVINNNNSSNDIINSKYSSVVVCSVLGNNLLSSKRSGT